ncbi:uncharacterized protein LOC101756848 [Setaria italica]|uniref:uncharacterized protein LOC101756848 n=1 Tax=Setaria italica TaxID=4555 RepID=UPI000BE62890|nr:uncharacterized protein LOC101756848 [Setaria italica]
MATIRCMLAGPEEAPTSLVNFLQYPFWNFQGDEGGGNGARLTGEQQQFLISQAIRGGEDISKGSVSFSVYITYLEEYHRRNVHAVTTDTSISALAETCLSNEKQLVSELKLRVTREQETSLMIRRSIILSCLIQEHARSVVHTADCSFSDVSGAALLCIAKEAGLTCELLRRGADPIDDYLINQGRVIRLCALSLMNCTSVYSSAAMLGMAKEAEMMCMWMLKNNKPVYFYDDPIPREIRDRHIVRSGTLNFMVSILEKSSAEHTIDKEEPASRSGPRGDGYGIAIDGAANTTRGSMEEEGFLEKLWGWERLVPLCSYVKWSDYGRYLEEYYKHNANEFVAAAAAAKNPQNTNTTDMGAAVAKFCLKMEEELLRCSLDDTSTIIESSLIKERALKICGTRDIPSIVAFVCIKEEADLMCELLKHGAKPSDDIIQLSSVIRMCALSLVYLREPQSIASAAAMVGMANEAKRMCDWMKRENKLITLSLSQPRELYRSCLIRMKALDVMTRMLHGCFFSSSKQNTVRTAATSGHPNALPEEGASSQASVEDSPKRRPKPNKPDAVPEEGAGSQASVEDSPNPKRRPKPNKT